MLEVSISIVIVAAMAGLIAQAVLWRSAQQRSLRWRELAVIEAGNLMDRAASLPHSELTQENLNAMTLPESLRDRTPPATSRWTLTPAVDDTTARQITLEIQLPGQGRAPGRAVRLTSWRYSQSFASEQDVIPKNQESGQP